MPEELKLPAFNLVVADIMLV